MIGLTGLTGIVDKAKFLLNDNSHAILTGVGVTGSVTTAYLTGRASFRAAQIIEEEEKKLALERNGDVDGINREFTKLEKVGMVWRLYIPPVGLCLTTVISIIAANRVASRRMAALAVASGISERALQEYKTKVVEKFGERENTKIRDEIAQDRVGSPAEVGDPSREVIIIASGKVLCYDMLTGRYFESTMEDIKRAENAINHELVHFMSASLSDFYDHVGLPGTAYTDSVGWNSDNVCKVVITTAMTPDNRPCLAIDFENPPIGNFNRLEY